MNSLRLLQKIVWEVDVVGGETRVSWFICDEAAPACYRSQPARALVEFMRSPKIKLHGPSAGLRSPIAGDYGYRHERMILLPSDLGRLVTVLEAVSSYGLHYKYTLACTAVYLTYSM